MANYKRKKPRRQVKCTLCTDSRFGNSMKNATKQTKLIKLRVKQTDKKLIEQKRLSVLDELTVQAQELNMGYN
jgi:glucose-6-phosphate-specific signal transduction histidine kinase